MAEYKYRHIENKNGDYFVDINCIACDTCSSIAPGLFRLTPDKDHAYVCTQPQHQEERQRAQDAMYSCPVDAIGTQS